MSVELQQRVADISRKAGLLTQRCRNLSARLDEALTELELQRRLNRQLSEQNSVLTAQLENIRIAGAITPGSADYADARSILSELVCEIDRCITDLTHDE
ncbi:MAG: hypothetical protein K2M05_06835 [Paramuribaculum sp.]|nr:hypothetical protein [Paramuribaculum sp.]MDE6303969.1 hypothetical protein [Paramuribaculum sp.]